MTTRHDPLPLARDENRMDPDRCCMPVRDQARTGKAGGEHGKRAQASPVTYVQCGNRHLEDSFFCRWHAGVP